ncbi:Fez1, partial [Operophtera brumata]
DLSLFQGKSVIRPIAFKPLGGRLSAGAGERYGSTPDKVNIGVEWCGQGAGAGALASGLRSVRAGAGPS